MILFRMGYNVNIYLSVFLFFFQRYNVLELEVDKLLLVFIL